MVTFTSTAQHAALRAVEFDCPFEIANGAVLTGLPSLRGVHAPDVEHDDDTDVTIWSDDWSAWSTGRSGQYGYSGAVMHASEYLGGRMADDLLAEPGVYCLTTVEVTETDDETGYAIHGEPAGWIILRHNRL